MTPGWPPPAGTGPRGPGTRRHPPRHPHRPHRAGVRGGDLPGRQLAGHRQLGRDRADLGRDGTPASPLPAIPARCTRWRSPPTAASSPPAVTTGPRGPGMPMAPSAPPSPATPARCTRWRSPPTAAGWPPPARDGTARTWDADGTPRVTLTGHTGPVYAVAISPDGSWLATASSDGTARTWDADGTPRVTLTGHTGRVRAVAISPDGSQLATASVDGTARTWDADRHPPRHPHRPYRPGAGGGDLPRRQPARHRRRRRDRADLGRGTAPSASPSPATPGGCTRWRSPRTAAGWPPPARRDRADLGRRTAAPASPSPATPGGCTRWRSPRTAAGWPPPARTGPRGPGTPIGTLRVTLTGHTGPVYAVAISPDGSWLATASSDGTARTWDADGTPRVTLTGHTGPVYAVAISPDGSWLATASSDGTARTWDAASAPPASPSPATPARCTRWRSPPTAAGSPPPASTGLPGSGTPTAVAPVQRRYESMAVSLTAPGFLETPTCASLVSEVSTDSRSCRPPNDRNLSHNGTSRTTQPGTAILIISLGSRLCISAWRIQ